MASTPSIRGRQDLRLAAKPSLVSANASQHASPTLTPLGTVPYSPFRSAGLRPPIPYVDNTRLMPKRTDTQSTRFSLLRLRKLMSSKFLWLLIVFFTVLYWWTSSGQFHIQSMSAVSRSLAAGVLDPDGTRTLQFVPASDPKIHYVGRWTATPNQLRVDGSFSGVYLDITINSTKSLFLSLHNAPLQPASVGAESAATTVSTQGPHQGRFSFPSSSLINIPASPVSLLARIDDEEYVILPNSSSLVTIRSGDLDPNISHKVRIVAPMLDDQAGGVVQLEGFWLEKGGKLNQMDGPQFEVGLEDWDEHRLERESRAVGREHSLGWARLVRGGSFRASEMEAATPESKGTRDKGRIRAKRKPVLEVVTDYPGFFGPRRPNSGSHAKDDFGLLGGVEGWEYLLGEMFEVDHITLGLNGMCLVSNCIGGAGFPAGIGDVFFRSGPPGSIYSEQPWMFHRYVPDVMIFNLGTSDYTSYQTYQTEYNKTAWEVFEAFEDSYVSLIKAIRQLAYPRHPEHLTTASSGYSSSKKSSAAVSIFIMRPLRGDFEHATQGAVKRLRAEGDSSIFWLDTSGWLNTVDGESEGRDFYLDDAVTPSKWRLTERANQQVAMYLHLHVCQYLAAEEEQCTFLPPQTYEGGVFNPTSATFDLRWQNAKERKLKEIFWNQ